jgi:hypothetical protein
MPTSYARFRYGYSSEIVPDIITKQWRPNSVLSVGKVKVDQPVRHESVIICSLKGNKNRGTAAMIHKHVWVLSVERLYCKRPIQNIDPPPPNRPASVNPPPPHRLWCGGRTHSLGGEGGWGVNILEDARHCSVLYIRKYFVVLSIFNYSRLCSRYDC